MTALKDLVVGDLAPVGYAVIEFGPGEVTFPDVVCAELARLSETGVIRVLDLLVMQKAYDGSVEGFEVDDLEVGRLRGLESEVSEVLADDDVHALSVVMDPGTVAGVVVWESRWGSLLSGVALEAGGQVLAMGSIPLQALVESLNAPRESERVDHAAPSVP